MNAALGIALAGLLFQPAAVAGALFVVLCLLAIGAFAVLTQRGVAVRHRLAAYAPLGVSGIGVPAVEGGLPFLKREQYSSIPPLDWLLEHFDFAEPLSRQLRRGAIPLRVGEYLLIQWGLALVAFAAAQAFSHFLIAGIAAGLTALAIMPLYVRWRGAKRMAAFEDQLPELLTFLINALRSGYSLLQGMEAAAREMPDPVGPELNQALRDVRLGGNLEDALLHLSERMSSKDFDLVVTATVIQRQVGGNLTEILSNIAHTVRERHRILRQARVLTAEERLSGFVIAGLPVAMVVLLTFMSPTYLQRLWDFPLGRWILALGFALELLGLLVIRRIVDIEV